jgi:hypothetical protein
MPLLMLTDCELVPYDIDAVFRSEGRDEDCDGEAVGGQQPIKSGDKTGSE